MTDSTPTPAASVTGRCPFDGVRTIPTDGTPLNPSPTLAEWREEGAATPLHYTDGHDGWIVTRHELARLVLEDTRFSQQPQRMPGETREDSGDEPDQDEPAIDDEALAAMEVANLLGLDSPQHTRVRRSILGRFSVRAVRGYEADVAAIVARQLDHLKAQGSPADLTKHFAQPISAAVHSRVLGIPDSHTEQFSTLFVGKSTTQQKVMFLREVLAVKRENLGADVPSDDVISELIRSDLTDAEVAGVTLVLFTSGRDSVAYMIATATVALLSHPAQLNALRDDPTLIAGAIEEFMRCGAMFITLFARTATEDVDFGDVHFSKGESVSVSPVASNRDERRFENPERFDITRDAYGHLGFGHGIHGCVGQQLARLEIRQAITQLLAGLAGLHLVEAEQDHPMRFAHPVATYEAGSVVVGWN